MNRTLITIGCTVAMLVGVAGCGKKAEPAAKPAEADPKAAAAADPGTAKATPDEHTEPPTATTAPTAAPEAKERLTGPVAKVNEVPIDAAVFYAELDKITARNAKIPAERLARIESNILKRLIEKELIRQAVEKASIKVEDGEIDAAFEEYKKRFQTDEQFQNYLRHGRVSVESIKERLHEKRALEKLIEAKGNLGVDEAEAKDFYDKNERFYVEKAGVRASHILVKLPENPTKEQEEAALGKIKELQKELKGGKDFEELAKASSEGPSAPKGGDLGFFGKGQMVKEFEEAAFNMKPGDVSGPIRTRFGFHIIKVTDKREERKKPLDEVKDQIVQSLKNKKFFQERRKLLQDLEREAKIEKMIADPPPPSAHGERPGRPGGDSHGH